ncbi:uncharacterized protein LOC128290624 [Gossypium arboreum]|uniref:uncharacterized protein LOC128290624 n=1 Tax=Gossypium arboreum TaxID=29729 RepID=UPI0022F1C45B|nr:uncharacterized protein LOC128290624 [Gossypium arboreum]
MATINSIKLLGEDFSDSRAVEKVITTLPERFESKISSLEDSRDLTTIYLSELVNSLYALEQRRANRQEEHLEGAFQAKIRKSSGSSQKGKKPWLDKREKPRREAGKRRFPPCVHLYKKKWKAPAQQQIQAQAAEDLQAQEEHVFTASGFATSSKVICNWLVDNGCAHHMAADESLFKDLNRSFASKVKIGNENLIEAKGNGNVVINTGSGNKVISDVLFVKVISDVLFVPDIDQNLLNLEKKAYTSLADNAGLWHRRLGHANFRSLDLLHKLNLVDDMSKVEARETVYKVCQLGKQARLPFPVNQAWRAREKLELVHSDKSEVFDTFSRFKALVENQSDCKIKALRIDNGTEYLSERFQKLCEQAGIHHQLTTVYTPQQNGACERKNMIVMDVARCLLFQSKLPGKIWAEAVNTSLYLLNKLPTRAVKEKTPFEAWYGLKPSVSHLKVIGCVCYVLIPAERRTKLERRYVIDASQFEEDQFDISLDPAESELGNADIDDPPVRGTRTIADIYHRCNIAIVEPLSYEETARNKYWKKAMEAELDTIHKNETWDLAPRAWYDKVDAYLSRLRFEKSLSEPTLYVKKTEDETLLIVSIYVDDLLVTGSKSDLINDFKTQMQEVFDMTDLGIMTCFLATRPDLIHAVSLLSRFIIVMIQHISRQLRGYLGVFCWSSKKQQTVTQSTVEAEYIVAAAAVNQAIWLRKLLFDLNEDQSEVTKIMVDNQSTVAIAKNLVFHDANWGIDVDDRRSTTGFLVWLESLLSELHVFTSRKAAMWCDNSRVVVVFANPVLHSKFKHVKLTLFFVRKKVATGKLSVGHVPAQEQVADVFSKPLLAHLVSKTLLAPSSVLHPSTLDGGRGNNKRAFQPLIKPYLKAKPSKPGQSRSGGFPLLLEFELDDGGRSSGDAIRFWKLTGRVFAILVQNDERCQVSGPGTGEATKEGVRTGAAHMEELGFSFS